MRSRGAVGGRQLLGLRVRQGLHTGRGTVVASWESRRARKAGSISTTLTLPFSTCGGRIRSLLIAMGLAMGYLAVLAPTVSSEARRQRSVRAVGPMIIAEGSAGRLMRGDYEPIDIFMVVYHELWESSLRKMIEGLAGVVDVQVLYSDADRSARRFQRQVKRPCVGPRYMTVDSPWIRDYGPLQATDHGEPLWLDYGYALDRTADDAVPAQLARDHGALLSYEEAPLDGGAVISNGHGLCVITDRSLAETELKGSLAQRRFAANLGCRGMAVIPALPAETTGHSDVFGQFLSSRTLAFSEMSGPDGELLELAVEIIRDTAAALRQRLDVVRVPMVATDDVFYSYVNGTRAGDRFLIPSYAAVDAELQSQAYAILGQAMPGVQLIPIEADEMVTLGGAIHCITLGLKLPGGGRCETLRDSVRRGWMVGERPRAVAGGPQQVRVGIDELAL